MNLRLSVTLALLIFSPLALADDLQVTYVLPQAREDGSALLADEITSVEICISATLELVCDPLPLSNGQIFKDALPNGESRYLFGRVTDVGGLISDWSKALVVTSVVSAKPGAPVIKVQIIVN